MQPQELAALQDLPGVDHAALVTRHGSVDGVLPGGRTDAVPAFLLGVTDVVEAAAEFDVRWAGGTPTVLRDDEVLPGATVADGVDLGPLDSRPVAVLQGRAYVVRGIVENGMRVDNVVQSVMTTADVAAGVSRAGTEDVYVVTSTEPTSRRRSSCARRTPTRSPLRSRPTRPRCAERSRTTCGRFCRADRRGCPRCDRVADQHHDDVRPRTVARARDASRDRRPGRDISALVMAEAAIVGAAGGTAGAIVGVGALLVISIVRRWTPVLDLSHIPLALLGGIAVGVVGGVAASLRALRI